jgi:nucleoside-diphosphate-sugar epimerase
MKIVVAGGTGLIGSALLKRLAGKNDVVLLTRRPEEAHKQFEGAGFQILSWSQPEEQLFAALENSDALIISLELVLLMLPGQPSARKCF